MRRILRIHTPERIHCFKREEDLERVCLLRRVNVEGIANLSVFTGGKPQILSVVVPTRHELFEEGDGVMFFSCGEFYFPLLHFAERREWTVPLIFGEEKHTAICSREEGEECSCLL